MPQPDDLIDPEVLKKQVDPLSEEQQEKIRKDFLADGNKDEPEDDEIDEDDDGSSEPGDTPEEKEPEAEEEEPKDGEEDEDKGKEDEEDEDKPPEEEPTEKPKEPEKSEEEMKAEQQKLDEKRIEDYAFEKGIGIDLARKEMQGIKTVIEKYKNDQYEIAKAYYHLRWGFDNATRELSRYRNQPKTDELTLPDGTRLNAEESKGRLVEAYRKEFPERTENMEDDVVFVLAKEKLVEHFERQQHEDVVTLRREADRKRKELIDGLADEDKPFLKHIQMTLGNIKDETIVGDTFDMNEALYFVRGMFVPKLVREAEERGYTRGLEQRKILGAKESGTPAPPSTAPPQKKKRSTGEQLTELEKERALSMFDNVKIDDEAKFGHFLEYKKGEKKKSA